MFMRKLSNTEAEMKKSVAYKKKHVYFEHWVFLVVDNMFSYYNKDTRRNQNKVINERNIVFRFTR